MVTAPGQAATLSGDPNDQSPLWVRTLFAPKKASKCARPLFRKSYLLVA
jgi:hypothetical protein